MARRWTWQQGGDDMAENEVTRASAESVRRERFGRLPERIRPEDTFQELQAAPHDPARDDYNDDEWLIRNVV
jgi:hypothetical protein